MSQPPQAPISNAFMQAIFNSQKKSQQGQQAIQMPELALRCAQFFHSLSQYCLYFYRNYNRESDIHKTKLIKKIKKNGNTQNNNINGHINKRSKHCNMHSSKSNINNNNNNNNNISQSMLPKKPLTAYIIYFQQKKPSFALKFPSLSLSQLTKLIAKQWKDLSQQQKKPYLDKASNDRKRYQNQMNQFKKIYHQSYQNQYKNINQHQNINENQFNQYQNQIIHKEYNNDNDLQDNVQDILLENLEEIQNDQELLLENKQQPSNQQEDNLNLSNNQQDQDNQDQDQNDNDNEEQSYNKIQEQ